MRAYNYCGTVSLCVLIGVYVRSEFCDEICGFVCCVVWPELWSNWRASWVFGREFMVCAVVGVDGDGKVDVVCVCLWVLREGCNLSINAVFGLKFY